MPIVSFETLDDAANPNIPKPGANAKKPCRQMPQGASSPEKERQNITSNRYCITRITLFGKIKTLMRFHRSIWFSVALLSLTSSCTATVETPASLKPALKSFADTGFARALSEELERIESGDMTAWDSFANHHGRVDGERSFTYSLACGELARRDPTIFLRRHLAGDKRAVNVGKRAYGSIGPEGRRVMEWIHVSRLELATNGTERESIENFINALNSVLNSIDKTYR